MAIPIKGRSHSLRCCLLFRWQSTKTRNACSDRQTLLLPIPFVNSQQSGILTLVSSHPDLALHLIQNLPFISSNTSSPGPFFSPTECGTMGSIIFEERNPQGTSPFFNRFPLEIRRMIYMELFGSRNVHVTSGLQGIKMEWSPKLAHWICGRDSASPHKCIRKDHEWQCLSVHLMFTCKQAWVFSDHHNLSSIYLSLDHTQL